MMMWRAMTALTLAVTLGACQHQTDTPPKRQAYECAGIPVHAEFVGESLILSFQNTRHQLQHTRTASGAKYETPEGKQPKITFWEKGSEATLEQSSHPPVTCTREPPPRPPLTARGQEPGWILEMNESTLTLNYQYGQKTFTAPTPKPEAIDNGARYLTRNKGKTLSLTLTRQYCEDSMSGMPYPYNAKVTLANETLHGCAGDPESLLIGAEWVVEDINGQGIIDSSRITLNFTDTGKVHGLASCNRYNGNYRLTGEGLRIEQVAQTRMACAPALMQQEEKLLEALDEISRFRIDKTGALRLIGSDNRTLKAYRSWKAAQ